MILTAYMINELNKITNEIQQISVQRMCSLFNINLFALWKKKRAEQQTLKDCGRKCFSLGHSPEQGKKLMNC